MYDFLFESRAGYIPPRSIVSHGLFKFPFFFYGKVRFFSVEVNGCKNFIFMSMLEPVVFVFHLVFVFTVNNSIVIFILCINFR